MQNIKSLYQCLLFFLCVCILPKLFAKQILKEKFIHAKSGDFTLYARQKNYHLLVVHSINSNILTLEEMSFSGSCQISNIKKWLPDNMLKATCHNMLEIDLEKGMILECFSFTQGKFLQLSKDDCFILSLATLSFEKTPFSEKKRIGPAPPDDRADHRKIWCPPYIIEGVKEKTTFIPYFATWPKDNSPFSNKKIEAYFANTHPFAYFIEIKDGSGVSLRISCKDSGSNLKSSIKSMPRRRPKIVSSLKELASAYTLKIFCPPYYKNFKLFAHNTNSSFSTPYEIKFQSSYKDEENILKIQIDKETLKKNLEPNQTYCLEFHTLEPIFCRMQTPDTFFLNNGND